MRRHMTDAEQIAAGCFFTEAELRAKPHLQRLARSASPGPRDPNTLPVSAEARRMAEGPGVCAWCYEPGDERSDLVEQPDHFFRHPECQDEFTVKRQEA
jgi:hypothetical protein